MPGCEEIELGTLGGEKIGLAIVKSFAQSLRMRVSRESVPVSRLSVLIPRVILAIICTARSLLLKINCKQKYHQIPDTRVPQTKLSLHYLDRVQFTSSKKTHHTSLYCKGRRMPQQAASGSPRGGLT